MNRFLGLLAALAATALLLALSAGQAVANHVHCGDVITQDTKLDSDLTCPSGQYDYTGNYCRGGIALYVRDSIVLDLGGHTITAGPHIDPYCGSEGLQVLGGSARNGTFDGFDTGVSAEIGTDEIRNLTVLDSDEGIRGSASIVSSNTLRENRFALNLYTGQPGGLAGRMTVTRNTITDTVGDGITVDGPGDLLLDRNVVTNSGQHGINIYSNLVGIPAEPDNGTFVVTKNRTDYNGADGIRSYVASTTISKNEASFNGNLGIEAVSGTRGTGNRARRNGNPLQCVPTTLCGTTGKPKE
jgi:hypothetical protein